MDKYEYRAKTEQMLAYAEQKSYQKAMSIADTIDWRKVKNTAMLSTVSEIYENAGELGKARDTLFIAYDKAPSSRKVVYRLGIISLKLGHFDEAADCYEEFVKLAPKDPNQYILRYKILKAQKAPVKEQIEALEDFKHSEYVEKWAYELARLYAEAGMTSECLDECDDLILWFSEGTYVYQAMELKMKYKPLTPLQQEKYDHRNDGIGRKDSSKRKPSFRKSKGRPEPNPRIADKVRKDVHVTDSIDLPDLPEPMARTHASEPEAESQPKTRIRSTSDISTTISGASLSDALKAGVAVASGAVAPESASDDSQMTGKMKIEEILANWEATQRENAKILEKSQEEAEKEKALREKKKEEEEVLGATKPILSDDIRKLMEQLENGEEPEITDEDAEDFVDDEEDEATESPEDSSKEASDTDEEDPEENDFEEIVDSEEDDESDAVYDEEAEYEDEDDSEYDDDEEYEDEDDSEYDDDEEYEDEDDSEYDDDEEYEDEDDSEYDDDEEYEDEDDSEYDDDEEYEDEDDSEYDDDEEYEDEDDSEYDDDEEYEDEDDSEYDDDEEYEDEDDSEYDDEEEYEDEDEDDYQIDDELDEDHKEDFDFEKESALDIDDHDSDEDDGDFADLDSFEDEEELDSSDDYLDLEFDEKPAPEPKKETSKSAPTPDIDEVLEIEEPSEDEITERMGKFDTGFVVQGRYDLSATSEIGLKLGLTEEQKQLFSYFVPIRGVSEQLVEILDNDKRCRNRYGTSRTGNILILGRKGSGKTVLAVDIVKAIQKQRRLKQGKVAIVTGDSLNKKDIGSIIDKLNGGALIIEKASKMNDRTIRELNDMMDEQTGELLFLLEDQKKPLERMFASHREFKRKFTSRLELPVFINDELVTFGQTYAKENGYRIDEMGILALYSRIDMMQREDHAVTVAEVKEIMDEAISHSQKANVKHLVKRVFGRNTDNSDHIILKEDDFKS
ncbi:tetratricopeptide repeat protein [Coprococcus comes]|uniref:tetratricopeptide repeat protein n=1 Tax=Coprococcus comes TaxID=410072 RepID=UPI001897DFC0|nr:tetratricopeptide repeat protein [Coprococcus comes]MDC0786539.1 tetratricopeptide repeat protein [Coprococcus comes]MDC0789643.1 tetratricopeptide repeat protein [Coprococcus comes]MDC0792916.1 tetratricopeptide repeat protein [Coprococcus comes]MDC0796440.1 tetratricopeptide repeat protein [Coprococcus comes]